MLRFAELRYISRTTLAACCCQQNDADGLVSFSVERAAACSHVLPQTEWSRYLQVRAVLQREEASEEALLARSWLSKSPLMN